MTFNQIAEELNIKGYLSARGKVFKGNHVHSIVKKKRIRDERFYRKYPEEWSDISFEVVDKSLIDYLNRPQTFHSTSIAFRTHSPNFSVPGVNPISLQNSLYVFNLEFEFELPDDRFCAY